METMRYSEVRKKGKGPIIGFAAFVIIGCAFIAFGMYISEGNSIFGNGEVIGGLVNIYEDVNIYRNEPDIPTIAGFEDVTYNISEKTYSDKSNKKIKSSISIPSISIDGVELTDLNNQINKEYTDRFASFKETLSSAENTYTYKVTYNVYENVIGDKKVISITIWQRTVDDSNSSSVFDKIDTYNIDVVTKELVSTEDAAKTVLGDTYSNIIKDGIKSYVVSKCGQDESTFLYTMSGFEKYYIKNGNFHIIINTGEIVDKKYGVLDIIIK